MGNKNRFSVEHTGVKDGVMTSIVVDEHTGVQYLLAVYPNQGSGLVQLVDAQGKPLLRP